jgi:DNA invertase Pin-like site-specific DNA recombinase
VSAFANDNPEDRPAYGAMCDALFIDHEPADLVIAFHTDRLWRDGYERALFTRDARKHGTPSLVVTNTQVTEPTNPDDEFTQTMLVAISEKESADKQRRIKRQKAKRRAAGVATAPVVALGWYGIRHGAERNDGTTIYEPEAELIRTAAQRVLAGVTLSTIAREWNTNGVVKPYAGNRDYYKAHGMTLPKSRKNTGTYKARGDGTMAGKWLAGHVQRVLTNPRNAGHQTHAGEIIARDVWPAILDAETWERLGALFTRRARGKRTPSRQGAWTGIVRCAGTMPDGSLCGATMHRSPDHPKSPACFGCKPIVGRNACGKCGVIAHHVERIAHEWLVAYADGAELEHLVVSEDGTERQLIAELATEHAALDEWFAMLKAHELTRHQYAEAKADTEARIVKLTSELARVGARDAFTPYVGRGHVLTEVLAGDVLTPDEHRAVFMATGHTVWVTPAGKRTSTFNPSRVTISTEAPTMR